MRKLLFAGGVCLVLCVGFVLAGCGGGDGEAKAGTQASCPMTGKKIDKKYYVDHQGKRIYFCGSGCQKAASADPETAMKKLAEKGITPEDAPK